jgi:hypothetical protein
VRTLIAVKSCFNDQKQGCHTVIRETWGKGVNVKFFMGGTYSNLQDDEIGLNCKDDYDSLPEKTRNICSYAVEHGYEFTFLCDVDTFLIPEKLFKTDYFNFDYSGRFGTTHPIGTTFQYKDGRGIRHEKCHPWASGGFGYFLSWKAANFILMTRSRMWAEDMSVGNILGPQIAKGEITATDLQHFENEASWHYPAHRFGWNRETMKVWMQNMYVSEKYDR